MNPPVTVKLNHVIVDDGLQPRSEGLLAEHVAALKETPEAWPPVVLARINGALYLIDGFHRHEAARQLGIVEIQASIFDPAENADLLWVAFQLNAKHGRPLSLRDRKAYAARLIDEQSDLSDREIGRRCGLHHETVGALRNAGGIRIPERQAGQLPTDVGLFDKIRFAKASREQKAVAGYIQRLGIALHDPYSKNSSVGAWHEKPSVIARACFVAMGEERATKLLAQIETDATFILQTAQARIQLPKEGTA